MQKPLAILIGIFILALAAGAALLILPSKSQAPTTDTFTPTGSHADLIVVDSIKIVGNTITIIGKARGSWYFEASFPTELRNAAGVGIAQAPAQAQSDWMTAEFVPFEVTLTFPPQPTGSQGTLVLKKDNPSGEPSHDDSISMPVLF